MIPTQRRRRTQADRLERIADLLFVAAAKIETTRPKVYDELTKQILVLRIEVDQARAAEPKQART